MKILLTAFEPFNNLLTNSSLEVLKFINEPNIIKIELPVSYERSKKLLSEAISRYNPDYVISLGQAQGEEKIRIEYSAINYARASIPDNDGDYRELGKIFKDSDNAYFTNAKVEELVKSINEKIPTYLSLSAGGYICNTIYYTSLKLMNGNALFIHLPLFTGQIDNSKSMDLNIMVEAVKYIIEYINC